MRISSFIFSIVLCLFLFFIPAYHVSASDATIEQLPLALGDAHIIFLHRDGTVWSWGSNSFGQLGNGTLKYKNTPTPMTSLRDMDIVALAAGKYHSFALTTKGKLWAWGFNAFGQLGNGGNVDQLLPQPLYGISDIIAIDAGDRHSVALRRDGTVWTWGNNQYGQLGYMTDSEYTTRPARIPSLYNIVSIATTANHTVALDAMGALWTWGANWGGQLGDGVTHAHTPRTLLNETEGGRRPISISVGQYHVLVLMDDATVWTWGWDGFTTSENGLITNTLGPKQVSGLYNVIAIAAGNSHNLALVADGDIFAWGWNAFGELGNNRYTDSGRPVLVHSIADATHISASCSVSAAVQKDGSLWTWGRNHKGQLGTGTQQYSLVPQFVSIVPVTGLSLATSWIELMPNSSFQLTTHVYPSNATTPWVSWRSSNPWVATVSDNGLVKTSQITGTTTITVETFDGLFSAEAQVFVGVSPSSITLNRTAMQLTVDATQALYATVLPLKAATESVIWFSDNEDVVRVNDQGNVTGVSPGTTTITASTANGLSASCVVTVVHPPILTLGFTQPVITLLAGTSTELPLVTQPVSADRSALHWTSSDTNVATVANCGTMEAKSTGTAIVSVTQGHLQATITVEVVANASLKYIEIPLQQSDEHSKTWTINFSLPVCKGSLTNRSVYILDQDANYVPASVTFDSLNSKQLIITPHSPYEIGVTYCLYITPAVRSDDGLALKVGLKMPFTITSSH